MHSVRHAPVFELHRPPTSTAHRPCTLAQLWAAAAAGTTTGFRGGRPREMHSLKRAVQPPDMQRYDHRFVVGSQRPPTSMAHRAFRPVHAPVFGSVGSALAIEDKPMIAMLITILRNIVVPPLVSAKFPSGTM
jgi:hypothetical protein